MAFSKEARAWRDACRAAVSRQRDLLAKAEPETRRSDVTGAGGDVSLEMDRAFEAVALEELHDLAVRAAAAIVSEEVGELTLGLDEPRAWVILDPIDGSTNYANGLPNFSLSVAVASGPTMADVWFGYVFDFGSGEEFVGEAGSGMPYVEYNGAPLTASRDAKAEGNAKTLIGLESAEPLLVRDALEGLAAAGAEEIRVVGSIAIALCHVALGRFEGLMTCKQCRSVDAAAGQIVATSMGAEVWFDGERPSEAPLALDARYRLVAGSSSIIHSLLATQNAVPLVPR